MHDRNSFWPHCTSLSFLEIYCFTEATFMLSLMNSDIFLFTVLIRKWSKAWHDLDILLTSCIHNIKECEVIISIGCTGAIFQRNLQTETLPMWKCWNVEPHLTKAGFTNQSCEKLVWNSFQLDNIKHIILNILTRFGLTHETEM